MKKTISFDLSEESIKNAQKELNNILKKMQKQVNMEFISMSLDWIKNRAIEYLYISGLNANMVGQLANSFIKKIGVKSGSLILNDEKGTYIEFGVGIKGNEKGYPNDFAKINWEYNVPSEAKAEDGHWNFNLKSNEPLDMLRSSVEEKQNAKTGKIYYKTYGQQGVYFMYNAIMDYSNNISIVGQIYENAMKRILGN